MAAILIAPVYLVKYDIGIGLGLKAFYAAIIGGFNQMRGALLGGLLVGVVETLSAAYLSGPVPRRGGAGHPDRRAPPRSPRASGA